LEKWQVRDDDILMERASRPRVPGFLFLVW
jgi:hypothetical protein